MPRFYVQPQQMSRDKVVIVGSQAHHIANVLRLKAGDKLSLFDGTGYEYQSQIIMLKAGEITVQITGKSRPAVESPLELILGQSLIKADKLEFVIQKATELGISQLVPLKTARSRRINPAGLARKYVRWQNIAIEAARQCGRVKLPRIEKPLGVAEFCADFEAVELKLIFWEKHGQRVSAILNRTKQVKQVALLIGAEGGFSPDDVKLAQAHGFIPVGLGPRILRTETAAVTALSLIQYQLGDLS